MQTYECRRELVQAFLVFGVTLLDSVFNYWLPCLNLWPGLDTDRSQNSKGQVLELILFALSFAGAGVLPGVAFSVAVLALDTDIGSLLGRLFAKLRAERSSEPCCECLRWSRRNARNATSNCADGDCGVVGDKASGRSNRSSADRGQHWAELPLSSYTRVSPTLVSNVNRVNSDFFSCFRPVAASRNPLHLVCVINLNLLICYKLI